jgi:hypothetical protein
MIWKLFVRFDLWIHNKIMNPIFNWIQEWFHWNRYQLIKYFFLVTLPLATMVPIIEMIVRPQTFMTVLFVCGLVSWFGFGVFGIKELDAASDHYEETGDVQKPIFMTIFTFLFLLIRPFLNVVCCVQYVLVFILISISGLTIFFENGGILHLSITTLAICMSHVLDTNDIHPKDRKSVLEPKTAHQNAGS